MRIDIYTSMRNEARMLPYFLRHYEQFAQRIFVWENDSTDGTREMLAAHPKVVLMPVGPEGVDDIIRVEQLWPHYETLSRGEADWVIPVDGDEFVYHPDLMGALAQAKADDAEIILCRGYSMVSETFPTTSGQIYDEVRRGLLDSWSDKWVVHTPDARVRYSSGRHYYPGKGRWPVSARIRVTLRKWDRELKLLHFRCLGESYTSERNRFNLSVLGYTTDLYRRCYLPDKTRGDMLDWYRRMAPTAVDVVTP